MSFGGRTLPLVILLLATAFAGCLADDDEVDADDDTGTGGSGTGGTGGSGNGGSGGGGGDGTAPINRPPVAIFAVEADNGTAVVNATITFNGTASSDPDNDTLTFTWDFGDNATADGIVATHAFAAVGDYNVTLTVADGAGAFDSRVLLVVVTTPTFATNVTGAITLANPALLVVPAALNEAGQASDLENYKTVGLQANTFYQTHVIEAVPVGGAALTFTMATTAGSGDLNYVVFDGDGNSLIAAGTPTNTNQVATLTDAADLAHGTYQVFVYASAGAQFTYTLSVALS